jgi:hypothetical protein
MSSNSDTSSNYEHEDTYINYASASDRQRAEKTSVHT